MTGSNFALAECGCCSEKFVVEVEDPEDIDCTKNAIKTQEFYQELQNELVGNLGPMIQKEDIKEYLKSYLNCSNDLTKDFLNWLNEKGKEQGDHYVFPAELN